MKKVFRYFFYTLLIALTCLIVWGLFNLSLVTYGWDQLKGQMHIINNSRPLEEVLNDKEIPDSLKSKIRFIDVIAQYASDSLGLKRSENYTTMYDQKNKPILWVITASERYKLNAYQWKFPFLGNVSYKGFFDYSKGAHEDSLLQLQGYDTDYGEVSAWSTLGWFNDPILSNMLYRSDGQLAELIIHEMTHATVYLKSNVDLNENLASMIGEEGAIRFLNSHFGENSQQAKDYVNRQNDYDLFSNQMLLARTKLDSLYNTFDGLSAVTKDSLKSQMIESIVLSLDTVSFSNKKRYASLFKKRKPNNAYFMNFVRYDSQKEEMRKMLNEKYKGNIIQYLNSINN
ncbi:MAG: aminopeptidase [Bacteroidota bacterium]